MVGKKLMGVWSFLAFALLAASGILIAFSIIWKLPNLLLNFVIDPSYLTAGLGLGIAFAITFVGAIIAVIQPQHVTLGLVMLNWTLIVDAIGTVALGTAIWFHTLKERANYDAKWDISSDTVVQGLQDHFSCCGYFFTNQTTVFTGFCSNATFAANQTSCVEPVTEFADYTLNNIFTSTYGFMAVVGALFLATCCVINKRMEAERFRKIDLKRGGRGFV